MALTQTPGCCFVVLFLSVLLYEDCFGTNIDTSFGGCFLVLSVLLFEDCVGIDTYSDIPVAVSWSVLPFQPVPFKADLMLYILSYANQKVN